VEAIKNKQDLFCSSLGLHYIFDKKIEDRLRLGIKNMQAYFVLLSACTIFATVLIFNGLWPVDIL
jgi:hypothetical protein